MKSRDFSGSAWRVKSDFLRSVRTFRHGPWRSKYSHSGDIIMEKNLMQPMWIHAGELRRHLKAHTGERSNKCNQCDFAFIQAGNLRPHLKAHSGQKPKMQPMWIYRRFKELFENTTTPDLGERPWRHILIVIGVENTWFLTALWEST